MQQFFEKKKESINQYSGAVYVHTCVCMHLYVSGWFIFPHLDLGWTFHLHSPLEHGWIDPLRLLSSDLRSCGITNFWINKKRAHGEELKFRHMYEAWWQPMQKGPVIPDSPWPAISLEAGQRLRQYYTFWSSWVLL